MPWTLRALYDTFLRAMLGNGYPGTGGQKRGAHPNSKVRKVTLPYRVKL